MSDSNITSAHEQLSDALLANIIPLHEYLLQGSILDSQVENLLHQLKGLCDNADSEPETFNDHEICFSLTVPNQATPTFHFRVRKSNDVDAPFLLRYIGQEIDCRNRPTLVRNCVDVMCTSSIVEYLQELGCRVEFEFTNQGYVFCKGRMKITVSKIFKMGNIPTEPVENYTEAISQSYLVELSVLAPIGQDAIGQEMYAFAEELKPLVQMEKIDFKGLGNTP